jgi:CO dehydrogenase/acetyl-CoA synthase alpha subunit
VEGGLDDVFFSNTQHLLNSLQKGSLFCAKCVRVCTKELEELSVKEFGFEKKLADEEIALRERGFFESEKIS